MDKMQTSIIRIINEKFLVTDRVSDEHLQTENYYA